MIKLHVNLLRSNRGWNTSAIFFIGVVIFTFTGCTPQRHLQQAEIRPLPYSTNIKHVDGLRQALSDSPNAPVRILVVHGMITHEPKYSENMQGRLAKILGLVEGTRDEKGTEVYRGYDFIPFIGPQPLDGVIHSRPSEIRKTTWADPSKPHVDRLVFYEMLWAPLRDEIKNKFFACFESRSVDPQFDCSSHTDAERNSDSRTLINGMMKDGILVDGFADPMIVLGPVGDVLRDDMSLALCMVANDVLAGVGFDLKQHPNKRCNLAEAAQNPDANQNAGLVLQKTKFFAMTHSLGSFLFMDTQQRFARSRAKSDDKAKQLNEDEIQESLLFFLTDDAIVYMRANQIALLQLGRFSAEGCRPYGNVSVCPNRLLRDRKDIMSMDMPLNSMTTYVAFNDVNDLLGFELPPYLAETGLFGALLNVSVQNPGFTIPFLFKNPSAAHTGHEDNPAVIESMVEGIALSRQ